MTYIPCTRSDGPDPEAYREALAWCAVQGQPAVFAFFAALATIATRPAHKENPDE